MCVCVIFQCFISPSDIRLRHLLCVVWQSWIFFHEILQNKYANIPHREGRDAAAFNYLIKAFDIL